ncbi:hypothetical protein C8R44DRAFT_649148, partial [Mycena epipterygia]
MPDIRVPTPDDDDWLVDDLDGEVHEETVGDKSDAVSAHAFASTHPLYKTHYIRCDRRDLELMVPNFVGGYFPRVDQGDREFYCCTMLTLFKPWRSGTQLKNGVDNWHETFTDHKFNTKALKLMRNFNVKYECNDARDDFSAQDRQKRRALPTFGRNQPADDGESDDEHLDTYGEENLLANDDNKIRVPGPIYLAREELMRKAESIVTSSGWINRVQVPDSVPNRVVPKTHLSGSQWK